MSRRILLQTLFWAALSGIALRCSTGRAGLVSGDGRGNTAPRLVWQDEFDYTGLPDSSRWGYDVGDGCPNLCGWGNNELQYYTVKRPENARVENGRLIVEARRETGYAKPYTSARLVTRNKADWQYGRILARAKLPHGLGTWAAIWMLPAHWKHGGWPDSGEIDIMEYVGYQADSLYGTVHTKAFNGMLGTQDGGHTYLSDGSEAFHEYGIDWSPERIEFLMDGRVYHTFKNRKTGFAAWPFDEPFSLIVNLAVGGNWGGKKGVDESVWPQRLELDYIRVYQYP